MRLSGEAFLGALVTDALACRAGGLDQAEAAQMSKDMRLPIKRVDQLVGLKHLTFQREGVLSVREQEVRTDTEGVGQHDEALIGERPAPVHDRGAARSDQTVVPLIELPEADLSSSMVSLWKNLLANDDRSSESTRQSWDIDGS